MQKPTWRKSSKCETGTCVEVASTGEQVLMRHSARPNGGTLQVSAAEWAAFLRELNTDETVA
jgi:hypothetical protein